VVELRLQSAAGFCVAIGNRAAPGNMGAAFVVTKCGDGVL